MCHTQMLKTTFYVYWDKNVVMFFMNQANNHIDDICSNMVQLEIELKPILISLCCPHC